MIEGTSDIHGEYDKFMELLDKIKLKETDTLYILGDILDRGPHPIKTLRKLMDMPNVICIIRQGKRKVISPKVTVNQSINISLRMFINCCWFSISSLIK